MNIDAGSLTQAHFVEALKAAGFPPPVPVQRDPSYALGDHVHEFEAWVLVLEGHFTVEVDGVATAFPAGRSFRLPAGVLHKESVGPQGARYLSSRRESAR